MSADQFLRHLLSDTALQQEIANLADPLAFTNVQAVARSHGYVFDQDAFNHVLDNDPALVAQLQTLIDSADFELDESEMALIAGGVNGQGNGPMVAVPPEDKES